MLHHGQCGRSDAGVRNRALEIHAVEYFGSPDGGLHRRGAAQGQGRRGLNEGALPKERGAAGAAHKIKRCRLYTARSRTRGLASKYYSLIHILERLAVASRTKN